MRLTAADAHTFLLRVLGSALLVLVILPGVQADTSEHAAISEYRNLTYQGIYDHPVTVHDGVYEGEPFVPGGASRPRVELVEDLLVQGDLDGDSVEEAAVLLAESSGGSGVMTYLALVTWRDGAPVNLATRLIGDRVQIRSLRV
jgi:hypothetical protein